MKINLKFTVFIFALFNLILLPKLNAFQEMPPLGDKDVDISMDLQDASLRDVVKLLSIQSGLNFISSEAVQERKITLYLDKVPLKDALNKIFKANNLSYDLDKEANIFIVNDWGKPTVQTITKVFFLKHATVSTSSLKSEMKSYLTSTTESSASGSSGSSSGGSSSSGSGGSGGKWAQEDESGITKAVKKLLSKDGVLIEDYRTNSLIISDIPSRMEVVAAIITALDVAVPAVLLECEMLDVSKNVVDEIGVNWPQTIGSANFSAAYREFNPFGSKGTNPAGTITYEDSTAKILKSASWLAPHFGPVLFGVLNSNVTLDFLRTQSDTKFLARPKILTLDNETAEIKITTNEAIGVSSVQQGQGTSAATTVTAERYETGVSLRVTPQIDQDTGEITMFVWPQVTEASTTQSSFGSAGDTYTFTNPEVRSTKTIVRVKDGETVVLGGLLRSQNSTVIKKMPILGDLPIIGAIFRHKEVSPGKDRELLVFITPHLIKDSKTELVINKKLSLPQREQGKISTLSRQQSISKYMSSFEAKR